MRNIIVIKCQYLNKKRVENTILHMTLKKMLLLRIVVLIGSISGIQSVIISTQNGDIYLGIRYGQIATRWLEATLPGPWNDTLNATEFGSICYQYGPFKQPQPTMTESEDCLF